MICGRCALAIHSMMLRHLTKLCVSSLGSFLALNIVLVATNMDTNQFKMKLDAIQKMMDQHHTFVTAALELFYKNRGVQRQLAERAIPNSVQEYTTVFIRGVAEVAKAL